MEHLVLVFVACIEIAPYPHVYGGIGDILRY